MPSPKVSVVIPAYNQANFLAKALQSVLDQTYPNFEVIVVNDASPDHTDEVVKQFADPRLKYIVHEQNRGLPATRNTGIRASSGEIIALLDADDLFHPEKLQAHVDFLAKHPDVDVTYNARFELDYSAETVRGLVHPPLTVTLADLVLGYPFMPSDTVLRRDSLFQVGLFDEKLVNGGEDLDLPARLALTGRRFASVNRALNYRRHHSARRRKNIAARLNEVLAVLDTIFYDPRCSKEVLTLRDTAFTTNYLVYAEYALACDETDLGQAYLREAVRLSPSILDGSPCQLVRFLLSYSIRDENMDHGVYLKRVFGQFPPELARLADQLNWAIGQGYLLKGTRAIMWDRPEDGHRHFMIAIEMGATIDERFLQTLTYQLLGYEQEFGNEAAEEILRKLVPYLERVENRHLIRRLKGIYSVNRAFQSYYSGNYKKVPAEVLRAIRNDLKYLTNRGVASVLFRSIISGWAHMER